MESKLVITYHWNTSDIPDLSHSQSEELASAAEERIFDQRKEGYTSGELVHEIGEITVYGWYNISSE